MKLVRSVAVKIVREENLDDSLPLVEAGMHSLNTIRFAQSLRALFPETVVPITLVFDHPTLQAVGTFFDSEFTTAGEGPQQADTASFDEELVGVCVPGVDRTMPPLR